MHGETIKIMCSGFDLSQSPRSLAQNCSLSVQDNSHYHTYLWICQCQRKWRWNRL